MRRDGLFDDFISHGPIHSTFFRDCTPASLICLSKTCRLARAIVDSWMNLAYNINRFLSPYFDREETLHFRHLQANFGILISGSSALQFLDRTRYPASDLDVYVEAKFVDKIGHWLMSCGYEFKPRTGQRTTFNRQIGSMMRNATTRTATMNLEYGNMGIAGLFDMRKGERHIQLIGARRSPLEVILSFHSTCVMNFIAYSAAYSLYPRTTYEERKSLLIQTSGTQEGPARAVARKKYVTRGWQMIEGDRLYLSSPHHRSSGFGGMERSVGDRYTWTLPLNVTGVTIPKFMIESLQSGSMRPGSAVTANSWKLIYQPRMQWEDGLPGPIPIASYSASGFESKALKFVYLNSNTLPLRFFDASFERKKQYAEYIDADFNKVIRELYEMDSRIKRLTA